MWRYSWMGQHLLGETRRGVILAKSRQDAKHQLLQQGIVHTRIRRHRIGVLRTRLSTRHLHTCFQQLAHHLQHGMPILTVLQALSLNQSNPSFKQIFEMLRHDLSQGRDFFEAMTQYPECFSTLVCEWVKMGERFGTLPLVFQHIAEYYAHQQHLKQRLQKTLTYPITVMVLSSIMMFSLLILVVPQFASFYHYFSAELPWLTRCLLAVTHQLQQYGLKILTIFIMIALATRLHHHQHTHLASWLEKVLLATPFIGHIIHQMILSRLINTLKTTYACSLSLLDAFEAMHHVAQFNIYQQKITRIIERLKQGESVQFALQQTTLFPCDLQYLFQLGEETGALPQTLEQMSGYCEHKIDQQLTLITTVFEPLLMAILGMVMGIFILALYLPILNLGNLL